MENVFIKAKNGYQYVNINQIQIIEKSATGFANVTLIGLTKVIELDIKHFDLLQKLNILKSS